MKTEELKELNEELTTLLERNGFIPYSSSLENCLVPMPKNGRLKGKISQFTYQNKLHDWSYKTDSKISSFDAIFQTILSSPENVSSNLFKALIKNIEDELEAIRRDCNKYEDETYGTAKLEQAMLTLGKDYLKLVKKHFQVWKATDLELTDKFERVNLSVSLDKVLGLKGHYMMNWLEENHEPMFKMVVKFKGMSIAEQKLLASLTDKWMSMNNFAKNFAKFTIFSNKNDVTGLEMRVMPRWRAIGIDDADILETLPTMEDRLK